MVVKRKGHRLNRLDQDSLNPPDGVYPFIDWDDLDQAQKAEVALLAVDPDCELDAAVELELRSYVVKMGPSREALIQVAEERLAQKREDVERRRQSAAAAQALQNKQRLMAMPNEVEMVERVRHYDPNSLRTLTVIGPVEAYTCLHDSPLGWRVAKPGEMVMAIAADKSVLSDKGKYTRYTVLAMMK